MKAFNKFIKPILFRSSNIFSRLKPALNIHNNPGSYFLGVPIRFYMSKQAALDKKNYKSIYSGPGFYIQQLLTECLGIYSYYIESDDQCFLVDPDLQTQVYKDIIASRGKKLAGIFVTHYHADYVSGQYDLAKNLNCKIYMGPKSTPSDILVTTKDNQTIKLGKISLQVMHTPGHTEQSSCLILIDENGKKNTIFTGDTVFLDEVGRPDVSVKTQLSVADLASMLYDSLQKVKQLNDDLRILPGHGSGSACGKSIGLGGFCTLGEQKQSNYGLIIGDRPQFVNAVLAEMSKPPHYFGYNAEINKHQPLFFEQARKKLHKHLSPQEVLQHSKQKDVVIIDVRGTAALKEGIIQHSLCIGFDGSFERRVGSLLDPKDKLVLLGTDQQAKQSIARLLRIGYINIIGHANFPISEWRARGYPIVNPHFVDSISHPNAVILDVRGQKQWKEKGVVEGSHRMELSELYTQTQKLDKSKTYVTHCQSGYRAKIAYSYLLSRGYQVMAYPYHFDTIFETSSLKKAQI